MRKRTILTATLLILTLTLLSGCGKKKKADTYTPREEDYLSTIFVASDTHLLSNNLVDSPEDKMTYITDGRIQKYDYELVGKLVEMVNEEKPKVLVLTGDLSFNGETDSHRELIKLLDNVSSDTKVLVIPGNHDIYNLNPIGGGDTPGPEEFRELYKNYGYTDAMSYDEDSLSYAWEVDEHTILLMLDTTLCKFNFEENRNITGGFISGITLDWMEGILKKAQEEGKTVISFTHHNITDHNKNFVTGYTIIRNQFTLELFAKYDVNLNFSGHMHIQNIAETEYDGEKITDIADSSLLAYGNTVGRLKIYTDGYVYDKENVVPFEGFLDESFKNFSDVNYYKSLERYKANYPDNYEQVARLVCDINTYYFDGAYDKIAELKKANKKLIDELSKNGNNVNGEIFNMGNVNQKVLSGKWRKTAVTAE